jgi:hypothetical protein
MGKFIDMIKEKAKGTRDKFVNTKKEAKDLAKSSTTSSPYSGSKGEFEEGSAGTDRGRKDDPLIEYERNEPMTPAKIKEHEPTAVKRDPSDQKIVETSQTETDTKEAKEEYRKRGMTKTDPSDS